MIAVALLALALMALVAAWDRQLPDKGETFSSLSATRRRLSVQAIPVSAGVVGAFGYSVVNLAALENEPGYGDQMRVLLLGGAALGFSYLFAIAVTRVNRARRADRAQTG